ncbi:MAG: O-antigen ligase family protein [Candidatus Vogelbacteria bacterium]|nr:O-antigen ligase family protein [Candidatus Vogelbacteria bacterium]
MTGLWYFISLGIVLVLMSLVIVNDRSKHDRLILIICLSTSFYSILSVLGPEGLGLLFKSNPNDGFTFGNSSFAAMYLFATFMLSVYFVAKEKVKKWWLYLLPVSLLVNPYIISSKIWRGDFSDGIIGEARATTYVVILSLVSLIFVWLLAKIKDHKLRSILSYTLAGGVFIGIVFLIFSLLSSGGLVRNFYLSQSSAARPLVWSVSEQAISQRPYLGFGQDNFERVFEVNYDNRLLQNEYGGEAWFDRAHNIFIDQLVDNGLVGLSLYLLVYIVSLLSLIYVALNASEQEDKLLAVILAVYFPLHLLELQTAFDTSISYPILGFMFVSAAVLFHRNWSYQNKEIQFGLVGQYLSAGVVTILTIFSLIYGLYPFLNSQVANGQLRMVGDTDKRIPLYPALFGSKIDKQAILWRTMTDFQRGVAENPKVLENPKKVESIRQELLIIKDEYREYLKNNPDNFRAHLGLADVLIYSMLFGDNNLVEAQQVLDKAIELVPQSPQPYWMKAVAYVYMRKFDLAREFSSRGLALNPKIKQSQEVVAYVEKSIKTFPDLDLFFFRQI